MIIYAKIGDVINISCNLQNIPNSFNLFKRKRSINDDDNEEQYEISFSNNNNEHANSASGTDGNYEIDWWFIDKNGRNNIIRFEFLTHETPL